MENSFLDVLEYENLDADEPRVLNKYVSYVVFMTEWKMQDTADDNSVCFCYFYTLCYSASILPNNADIA